MRKIIANLTEIFDIIFSRKVPYLFISLEHEDDTFKIFCIKQPPNDTLLQAIINNQTSTDMQKDTVKIAKSFFRNVLKNIKSK